MKLQFLGTAAAEGAPALFCDCAHCRYARKVLGREVRTRSGSVIDGVLKLDFGPDSYKQMLDNGLDYTYMRSLLVTHAHSDHFSYKDIAFRQKGYAQLSEGIAPLTVYGNERVGELIQDALCDRIEFRRMKPFETVQVEDYRVTPLEAVHCIDGHSTKYPVEFEGKTLYRTEETLFYLIEKDGKRILYAHDTDEFTPRDMEFLSGKRLDLISMDCTNGELDCNYVGHMGAKDNLRMRDKLLACGAADAHTVFVANHFSHNGLVSYEKLCELLPGFLVSYDGMSVEV